MINSIDVEKALYKIQLICDQNPQQIRKRKECLKLIKGIYENLQVILCLIEKD